MTYTAKNIKVLSNKESQSKFDWLMAEELSRKYKKPKEFVERLIEACRLSNVSLEWGIDKYLKELPDVERNPEVEAISREIQKKVK